MAITDQDRRRAFADLLTGLPYLATQPENDVRYLLFHAIRPFSVGPRATLYEQDNDVNNLYFLKSGAVYQSRAETDSKGQARMVLRREVGGGTLLARYDLLYDQQYSTRARTTTFCNVIEIEAAAFNRLLHRFPALRSQLVPKLHRLPQPPPEPPPLSLIGRLRTIPLLGDLSLTALSFIADACEQTDLVPGAKIFSQDDPATHVYFIDQGQIHLRWADGREMWLGNSAAFGFLDHARAAPPVAGMMRYGHSATATYPTTIIKVPRKALIETADIHPEMVGHRLRDERRLVMDGLPVFADLSPVERSRLLGYCSHYHIPNHHLVMQQGEIGDSMWVLMPQRAATIYALDKDGNRHPSSPIVGPIYFSEVALRIQQKLESTVEAAPDSQWLRLHWRDFRSYVRDMGEPNLPNRLRLGAGVDKALGDEGTRKRYTWLQNGETLELLVRRHWIVLLQKFFGPMLVVAIFMVPILLLTWVLAGSGTWFTSMTAVAILAVFGAMLWAWLDYRNDWLLVTNQRVVRQEKLLFISEARQEAYLEQIQNIDSSAEFWGNVLGFGDVSIQTAGLTGAITFNYVPGQEAVKKTILDQVDDHKKNYSAKGKMEIQAQLEGRLGLQLVMHSGIQPPQADADIQPQSPGIFGRVKRMLRPPTNVQDSSRDRIIWRKHWAVLVGQLIVPFFLLVLCIIVAAGVFGLSDWLPNIAGAVELIASFVGVLLFAWIAWIIADWHNDTYEVGKTHIVDVEKKPLFFAENRRTARLGEIENVEMDIPTPLHYILNFGNVKLQTAATQGNFTFDWVPDPRGVTAEIHRRIQAYHNEQELQETRNRAKELPDWFEMYSRLNPDVGNGGGGNRAPVSAQPPTSRS